MAVAAVIMVPRARRWQLRAAGQRRRRAGLAAAGGRARGLRHRPLLRLTGAHGLARRRRGRGPAGSRGSGDVLERPQGPVLGVHGGDGGGVRRGGDAGAGVPGVHGGAAVLLPGAQRPRRPLARPRGLRRPHRAPVAVEEAAAAPGSDEDKPVRLGLLILI